MTTRTIIIHYVFPPIPTRSFDFQASFDDDEPDDNGHMVCGFGKTPIAAMTDLLLSEQMVGAG